MSGIITRQELSPELRQELDDVRDYIDGSVNEEYGAHMNNTSNPHSVTKSQVGLPNVDDIQQATKSEFNSHQSDSGNPHNVTSSQVGAPSTSRKITAGAGLLGGGDLGADRTLNVDWDEFDGRYLNKNSIAYDSERLGGESHTSYHKRGENYLKMSGNDGLKYYDRSNGGEFYYRIDGSEYRAYGEHNVSFGTGSPSGGKHGDIYIQY